MGPEVSIIIPCFNGGAYLPATLDSVAKQSFRDFEILVVDDGSTDPATLDLIDSLPPVIRRVRQANRGLPAARNAGMREAQGAFLLPLDCDDLLQPSFLEMGLELLRRHPEAAYAFSPIRLFGELSGTLKKSYNPLAQLFLNQLPYCLLMRKEIWQAVGGYDESMRAGYEDWEFNIRLAAAGYHGVTLDEPLFAYRVRSGGMLNNHSRRHHAQLWNYIQGKHAGLYTWRSIMALKRRWAGVALPYPLPWLMGLWALDRCLPAPLFNALYARLLAFASSRRAQET